MQLQRRHDLIPQIVKAVKQYAKYERATLEAITVLRTEAMKITDVADIEMRSEKEEQLGKEVHRLIAVAENYPDLKANENFLNLQSELVETENYLQFARSYIALLAGLVALIAILYNRLIRDRNRVDAAWSDIDTISIPVSEWKSKLKD